MRTPSELYRTTPTVYKSELMDCPHCGHELVEKNYLSGLKAVETMTEAITSAYRPKSCPNPGCASQGRAWGSARWQGVAPKYSVYSYEVLGQIGWERQKGKAPFEAIHVRLRERMPISESQVRYMYHQRYLPLLACHECGHLSELEELGREGGLVLSMDGLMPEGGEAQLWVVRELRTGWTVRSGWMNSQDEAAFIEFLQPIADLGVPIAAVMSDKQRALLLAVAAVFSGVPHGFCQFHYLDNAAEPIAAADEQMKIELRQGVRAEIGGLIRHKQAEKPAIPVVTGLLPSPVPAISTPTAPLEPETVAQQERESIVQDILAWVRYLLTLKGRPPFRLAGIEMFARLQEVVKYTQELVEHFPEAGLLKLLDRLQTALTKTRPDYVELSHAAQGRLCRHAGPAGKANAHGRASPERLAGLLDPD